MEYEENIVEPKYVFEKLGQENFKVVDCTVFIEIKKVGASTIHSGYEDYLKRHIPGSAYLHMVDDPVSYTHLTLPTIYSV